MENGHTASGRANGTNGSSGLALRDQGLVEYPYLSERALADFYGGGPRSAPKTTRDYLKVLFRHKSLILVTLLTVTGAVFVGLKMKTPLYEARVKMLILAEKQVQSPYYRDLESSFKTEMALTQSEIVKANPVLERTVKALKLDERPLDYEKEFASPIKRQAIDLKTQTLKASIHSPDEERFLRFKSSLESLKGNVKVKPVANTNLFTISVRDFSPIAAATIANTISRYYVIFDLEQQLAELRIKYGEKHLAVLQLRDSIQSMERALTTAPHSYVDVMGPASVKILEQASMPTEPVGVPKLLVLLVALVSSLFLGVVLAFCAESLDTTFRSPEDVERTLGLSLLGSVARRKFGNPLITKEPVIQTRYTQSFQLLADQMHMALKGKGMQTVLLTSALPGEGTTTIAANLAGYLARNLSHKVLLVDANLRRPALHRTFRISSHPGLSEVAEGKSVLETAVWDVSPTLSVLPAGRSKMNPVTLIDSPEMAEALRKAKEKYEFVLIDCSSLKNHRDAEILAAAADCVVVVIEAERTRRHAVKSAIAPLERKGANLAGAVLNKRVYAVPGVIYERV